MFCTQCGTPFELEQNFCKQCGARVNKEADPVAPSEAKRDTIHTAPIGHIRSSAESYPRERKAISLTVIAGMCLMVIAAGSIYFGTDLFRQPAKEKTPAVSSLPVANDANLPRTLGPEEKNSSGSPGNDNLSSPRDSAGAQALLPLPDLSRLPAEASPKPAVKTDGTESSHTSQSPDAQASARSATKPPAVASRRGSAGTYQTTRSTTLFESASSSSQVVANIPSGTRVDVVRAKGEWLEVHSRRGNPPGFIRREDAALIEKTE